MRTITRFREHRFSSPRFIAYQVFSGSHRIISASFCAAIITKKVFSLVRGTGTFNGSSVGSAGSFLGLSPCLSLTLAFYLPSFSRRRTSNAMLLFFALDCAQHKPCSNHLTYFRSCCTHLPTFTTAPAYLFLLPALQRQTA